ncbi:M42 family metallopeptidase [Planctomycetota bacterium]
MKSDRALFLEKLVSVASPSGFERPAQEIIKKRIGKSAKVTYDVHGNLIAAVNPDAKKRVMLAGHVDEIGLMITHIDKEGFISFDMIGGHDPVVLAGQRVIVEGEKGPVSGVIGRKPIHLMDSDDFKKAPRIKDLWIDIGAKSKKDAEKVVAVSDAVTVDAGFKKLRNNIVAARGFDDRVGAFVVAEVVRECAAKASKLNVGLFGVSTVQEELGLRGARTSAFGVDPDAGIAIDVGFTSDCPTIDAKRVGETALGKGPILHRGANINPILGSMLVKTAKQNKIPYQMQASPRATGTDANAIQISRSGVAAALISVPNRYMHTPVECVSLNDLDDIIKLITKVVLSMKKDVSFIPK